MERSVVPGFRGVLQGERLGARAGGASQGQEEPSQREVATISACVAAFPACGGTSGGEEEMATSDSEVPSVCDEPLPADTGDASPPASEAFPAPCYYCPWPTVASGRAFVL